MNRIAPSRRSSGFILPLIVVLMLILSLAGLAVLGLSVQARLHTIRAGREQAAQTAADAGLAHALHLMNRDLQSSPSNFTVSTPDSGMRDLDGTDAQYRFTVSGTWTSGLYLDATGTCGECVHQVHAAIRPRGLFEYAVFGKQGMELKNGTDISAINLVTQGPPLLAGTNSTRYGAIDLKSGVTINGDVAIGPNGIPEMVVGAKSGVTITGRVFALAAPQDLPLLSPPADLLAAPSMKKIDSTQTLSINGKCSEINLGNKEVLTIQGDLKLLVTGDVTLGNAAEIRIEPGGSLTMYLNGDLITKNGGSLNNLTQNAKALTIYGLEGCKQIELKNSGTLYAAVYAPNADVISHNSATIVGSIIANSFTQKNSATFIYDAALREVQSTDVGVKLIVSRWWED